MTLRLPTPLPTGAVDPEGPSSAQPAGRADALPELPAGLGLDGLPLELPPGFGLEGLPVELPRGQAIVSADGPALAPADPSQSRELAPGTRVGEYLLEARVGVGGTAEVYAATHPVIGRRAAVKVLHSWLCNIPVVVERFIREARAVNQIRHPNICDVFSFGVLEDGRSYFVMEWLEGETLAGHLVAGRLELSDALEVLDAVSAALAAAHRTGIVHRDVKPANVFLAVAPDGEVSVKLLDFGIAKLIGSEHERRADLTPPALGSNPLLTMSQSVVGTPAYLSPEQAVGQEIGPASDVYCLGVMAFEMVTGQLPFSGAETKELMKQHVSGVPTPPRQLEPGLPETFEALLLRMLAKAPRERPELEEVRAGLVECRRALEAGAEPGRAPAAAAVIAGPEAAAGAAAGAAGSGPSDPAAPAAPVDRSVDLDRGELFDRLAKMEARREPDPATAAAVDPVAELRGRTVSPAARRRRRLLLLIPAGGLAAVAVILFVVLGRQATPPPPVAPAAPPPAAEPGLAAATPGEVLVQAPGRLVLRLNVGSARIELGEQRIEGQVVDGRLEVPVDPPGIHTLQVAASGRRTHRQKVTVPSGQTVTLTIKLQPQKGGRSGAARRRDGRLNDLMDRATESSRR